MAESFSEKSLISKEDEKALKTLGYHQRRVLIENEFSVESAAIKELKSLMTDELKGIAAFKNRFAKRKSKIFMN
jgi:hypothetical protein